MLKAIGYAAMNAHGPLRPFVFRRDRANGTEVEIDVMFCGICHCDIHTVRNRRRNTIYPCVPGHEVVGRIRQIGSEVTRHAVGDLVGVGRIIDSCRRCEACRNGEENYCEGPQGWLATYNGPLIPFRGAPVGGALCNTFGGYSNVIVVKEDFVVKIPAGLQPAVAAPMLCAGITTYSPIKYWGVKPGDKVGIIGFGVFGNMAAKLARAMGAEVTILTASEGKRAEAERLGFRAVITTDRAALKPLTMSFDFMLSTNHQTQDLCPFIPLLKRDRAIVILGSPEPHVGLNFQQLALRRRVVAGSFAGNIADTQEVLEFCAAHRIEPDIRVVPIQDVNAVYHHVDGEDLPFRYVIDMATLSYEDVA